MDGIQGRLNTSLQFRLSAWLALAILVIALVAGTFSFVSAFEGAIDLQDDQLQEVAALLDRRQLSFSAEQPWDDPASDDSEEQVFVRPLGQLEGLSVKPESAASCLVDGMQTVRIRDIEWRLLVKTLNTGARIAVGQQTSLRDEIARDSALRTVLPFVILIPILLVLVGDLVRKIFRPLVSVSVELKRRQEHDLREITADKIPSEVRPFVDAINQLLSRVARSLALQRRFVADAAHELRSPLTALSLQAEMLDGSDMSAEARERLSSLRAGIRRTQSLLGQLLTLARAQSASDEPVDRLPVHTIFRQVIEELMPLAAARNIDLGVVGAADCEVTARAIDLKTLIRNLVDNAIRYSPDGGQVDLSARDGPDGVVLQVTDSGPGIPQAERQRVFDAFYRVLGNDAVGAGLGLSIVRTIASRIGAELVLGYADEAGQSGLCVTIRFSGVLQVQA
ncbi:MAG: ATP-binding region, ATPase-like:Histidine kinase, region:Histidine kinase N-terminal [Hydrocarboniphaga sp.]|uniref:ATP-binding protein n=1 Tax=Hydrocarboniphaga sp. TaxID=2033016 RepID=UPI00262CC499|nr:ATP-binding protein [Hydrocarboniphaga sp.]MDB5972584.1 ATP-binding region, ATPase-like:Histidine kinase, region:Histidine kinase N-terminal [Hydrocarboniphaga sp.]